MSAREWRPEDGDSRCQKCGRSNPCWRVDDAVWKALMPDDGVLCPTCFMLQADEAMGRPVWVISHSGGAA